MVRERAAIRMTPFIVTAALVARIATAFEPNFAGGIVRTAAPPRGWRSWNYFMCNIDQKIMEAQVDAIVSRERLVDGVPTSLLDMGYSHVGLDDCWQTCLTPNSKGFHNPSTGVAQINTSAFPDMKSMVSYGSSQNVTMGFYFDNCRCHELPGIVPTHYEQDAHLTELLGFGGVKIDSCGNSRNMTEWAARFVVEGRDLLVESCGNGAGTNPKKDPTLQPAFVQELQTTCPFSFFRVSVDVAPQFYSTVYNLNRAVPYLGKSPLSRQGCWAYPDMLEVGVGLTVTESKTHFAMWSIVSAPLILGFDLSNKSVMDSVWDVITNPEALNVSGTWAGHPGRLVRNSSEYIQADTAHGCTSHRHTMERLPTYQIYSKPLDDGAVALLIFNIGNVTIPSVTVDLQGELGLGEVSARDIWQRKDVGTFSKQLDATMIESHDCRFYRLTPTN